MFGVVSYGSSQSKRVAAKPTKVQNKLFFPKPVTKRPPSASAALQARLNQEAKADKIREAAAQAAVDIRNMGPLKGEGRLPSWLSVREIPLPQGMSHGYRIAKRRP